MEYFFNCGVIDFTEVEYINNLPMPKYNLQYNTFYVLRMLDYTIADKVAKCQAQSRHCILELILLIECRACDATN